MDNTSYYRQNLTKWMYSLVCILLILLILLRSISMYTTTTLVCIAMHISVHKQ